MFFNISNHPAHVEKSTWSAEQIAEAMTLGGDVVDIPFPTVTPEMSDEQIADEARDVAVAVAFAAGTHLAGEKSAAMVAGEYVTTIRIIADLQKLGIPCYFGQSNRVAEERVEDGKVVVVHKFVFAGFRKVPDIEVK